MLVQLGLIVGRTILAPTIRMMDQTGRGTAHDDGFVQSGDRQIAVQSVAGGPADDPAREQIDDDGQI
jgi:hypothetical protein